MWLSSGGRCRVGIHRIIGAIAAAVGIAAVPSTLSAAAHADTALFAGGTNIPPYLKGLVTSPDYPLNKQYFADDTVVDIPYPGTIGPFSGIGTPTLGESVFEGVTNLAAAIQRTTGPILVLGDSQGALVVDAVHARVSNDPTSPPASQMSFLVIADPDYGGVFSVLFPPGFTIPLVNYTIQAPVEDRYDVVVFKNEYDGAADFPDRPWNLLADANAILGFYYRHASTTSLNPYTLPAQNITVSTNSQGGTTTTYLNPAEHLPLTQPLRDIGVPTQLIDWIDSLLRPIVDAGYSRNDPGPVHGPTFSGGQFYPPTVDFPVILANTADAVVNARTSVTGATTPGGNIGEAVVPAQQTTATTLATPAPTLPPASQTALAATASADVDGSDPGTVSGDAKSTPTAPKNEVAPQRHRPAVENEQTPTQWAVDPPSRAIEARGNAATVAPRQATGGPAAATGATTSAAITATTTGPNTGMVNDNKVSPTKADEKGPTAGQNALAVLGTVGNRLQTRPGRGAAGITNAIDRATGAVPKKDPSTSTSAGATSDGDCS